MTLPYHDFKFRHKCPEHGWERCGRNCRRKDQTGKFTTFQAMEDHIHTCIRDLKTTFNGPRVDKWDLIAAPKSEALVQEGEVKR